MDSSASETQSAQVRITASLVFHQGFEISFYHIFYTVIECTHPPNVLPAKTSFNLSTLPVVTGSVVNITCLDGYTIEGRLGDVHQVITCIENAMWMMISAKPCEGRESMLKTWK